MINTLLPVVTGNSYVFIFRKIHLYIPKLQEIKKPKGDKMKQFVRVTIKNWEEEKILREAFKGLPIRVVKGFNSLIISPKSENIKAKKGDNKYLQLLAALNILQQAGFKDSSRIIKF